MMAHPLFLALALPLLGACTAAVTLETAIPPGREVMEPALLGTWEIMDGPEVGSRAVVTPEGAGRYMLRVTGDSPTDSAVLMGRLGALGTRRWILELSPVGDTSRYTKLPGRDSTRLSPPNRLLLVPVHMQLVVERADSGLRFAALNADSLLAQLRSGRLEASYAEWNGLVFLTGTDPARLNAAIREFADKPGALIPIPRVGRRITPPSITIPF
jgi:hypothetical protein